MPIAVTAEHTALADVVRDLLIRHRATRLGRERLESGREELPSFWSDLASHGWLGLHIPERFGGSGAGQLELAVVVEQFGRTAAPGPFVPTVIASSAIAAAGAEAIQEQYLPGLADGSAIAGVALSAEVTAAGSTLTGIAHTVVGGALADVVLLPVGDNLALVDTAAPGVAVLVPKNLDPGRRSARITLSNVHATMVRGAREVLVDRARLLLAAEAAGVARECTDQAVAYAKDRVQFGRPIGTFQAVKHHCANMAVATELAAAAVWDAAHAGDDENGQRSFSAAVAVTLAVPAAVHNAETNIQVHGGVGYTWEHDAHLFLRRALAISALLDAAAAAEEVTALTRNGVRRERSLELPDEAIPLRAQVREFVEELRALDTAGQSDAIVAGGYAMPHWPTPWGRDAGAVEQVVIEQEFAAAGVIRPKYPPITSHVILTIIQEGSDAQIARYVGAALRHEQRWCQLFSEPDAGSDAASIKTRATQVDGGWLVNGQKIWTSGANTADLGLATVRTNPSAPKHEGITVMVIDMHARGVTVRPLRQLTGNADFYEVFLDDVFVAAEEVIGPIDGGWHVTRATLGNEITLIGGGLGSALSNETLITAFDARPGRLAGGTARVGHHLAITQALDLLNVRRAERAVAGEAAGPEGAVTKLVYSEARQEAAAIMAAVAGEDLVYTEGPGASAAHDVLFSRVWSIGGGTSEIMRNLIGERLLGLPREPKLA
jgi:alkylation response protein AidB-like acyl-CoA dehydrogenase